MHRSALTENEQNLLILVARVVADLVDEKEKNTGLLTGDADEIRALLDMVRYNWISPELWSPDLSRNLSEEISHLNHRINYYKSEMSDLRKKVHRKTEDGRPIDDVNSEHRAMIERQITLYELQLRKAEQERAAKD